MNTQDRKEVLEFKLNAIREELHNINQCVFVFQPRIQKLVTEMEEIKKELTELKGGEDNGIDGK